MTRDWAWIHKKINGESNEKHVIEPLAQGIEPKTGRERDPLRFLEGLEEEEETKFEKFWSRVTSLGPHMVETSDGTSGTSTCACTACHLLVWDRWFLVLTLIWSLVTPTVKSPVIVQAPGSCLLWSGLPLSCDVIWSRACNIYLRVARGNYLQK
jgi:hypothetical protein